VNSSRIYFKYARNIFQTMEIVNFFSNNKKKRKRIKFI